MSGTLQPVSFKKGHGHAPRLSEPYVPGRRSERYWTPEEDEIVRTYYPDGGVEACSIRLPQHHSSRSSIYQRARQLGLKSNKLSGKRQSRDYGPEMDQRIREAWPLLDGKKKGAVNALADELGVPRWWLSSRARRLGLEVVQHKKEPPWTAAETALMHKVPLHDPDRAAEIFREHGFQRSSTAIVVKAKRLDLSRRATHPHLSGTQASKILGVDNKTLTQWCVRGDLKATRRKDKRLPQQGGSAWDITRADLRQYVIDNLERIDVRKVDKFAFVDLLTNGAAA